MSQMRKQIIDQALKTFARDGYEATTLKEVTLEAGVDSESMAKYFSSKDDLFRACFEAFTEEKAELVERALRPPATIEEFKTRIELFVHEMVVSHFENPESYEIVHRETKAGNKIAQECFEGTLKKVVVAVITFFETAKNLGFVAPEYQPRFLARMILSMVEEVSRNEDLAKRHFERDYDDEKHRTQMAEHIIQMFLYGTLKKH